MGAAAGKSLQREGDSGKGNMSNVVQEKSKDDDSDRVNYLDGNGADINSPLSGYKANFFQRVNRYPSSSLDPAIESYRNDNMNAHVHGENGSKLESDKKRFHDKPTLSTEQKLNENEMNLSPISRVSAFDEVSPYNPNNASREKLSSTNYGDEDIDQIHDDDLESVAKYIDENRMKSKKRRGFTNKRSPAVKISVHKGDFEADEDETTSLLSYDIGDDDTLLGDEEDKYHLDSASRAHTVSSRPAPFSPTIEPLNNDKSVISKLSPSARRRLSNLRANAESDVVSISLPKVIDSATESKNDGTIKTRSSSIESTNDLTHIRKLMKNSYDVLNDLDASIANLSKNSPSPKGSSTRFPSVGKSNLESSSPTLLSFNDHAELMDKKNAKLIGLQRQKLWSYAHNAQLEREVEALQRQLLELDEALTSPRNHSRQSTKENHNDHGQRGNTKGLNQSEGNVRRPSKEKGKSDTKERISNRKRVIRQHSSINRVGSISDDGGDSDGTGISAISQAMMKKDFERRDTLEIAMESIDDDSFEEILGTGFDLKGLQHDQLRDDNINKANHSNKGASMGYDKPNYLDTKGHSQRDGLKHNSSVNISSQHDIKNAGLKRSSHYDSSDTDNDTDSIISRQRLRKLEQQNASKPQRPPEPSSSSSMSGHHRNHIRHYSTNHIAIATGTQITAAAVSGRPHQTIIQTNHANTEKHGPTIVKETANASLQANRPNLRVRTISTNIDSPSDANLVGHASQPTSTKALSKLRRTSRSESGLSISKPPTTTISKIASSNTPSTFQENIQQQNISPKVVAANIIHPASPRAAKQEQTRDILKRLNRRQRKPSGEGSGSDANSASEDDAADPKISSIGESIHNGKSSNSFFSKNSHVQGQLVRNPTLSHQPLEVINENEPKDQNAVPAPIQTFGNRRPRLRAPTNPSDNATATAAPTENSSGSLATSEPSSISSRQKPSRSIRIHKVAQIKPIEDISDDPDLWSKDLETRWHEVRLLLRRQINTDADMQYAIGAAEAGLLYTDKLNDVARNLNVLRGTISRWILPFDSNTRLDGQCSTPLSVLEKMPESLRGKISDRQIHYLVSGANSVRQLVRIKIADDNDLEQAKNALLKSKEFFRLLQVESSNLKMSPFELLQKMQK